MAYHLVENQKVSSQKIQDKGFQFKYPSVEKSVEKRVPKLRGTEKRYIYEQWIPQTKEEVFPFFADAKNLEKITPEILHFKVLNSSTETVQNNTEINYKLKINGVPVRWKTLIIDWNPPHQFVDNQEKGPYKKWHHTHTFEELGGGTLMTDQVDFIIPLGLLGYGMTSWKVEADVQNIFNYRREVIHEIYFKK
ncbi:MAG: DUF1731 domain-containing protein [Bdellovibrionales bacterium]|nr:DUF1731 domain-containing protein [Bdellovibrionales bacterium]NQZ20192.1 DUF1731 domain-containing protein [Bdellovibrionales bacterium]